jgi:hypothetical protein
MVEVGFVLNGSGWEGHVRYRLCHYVIALAFGALRLQSDIRPKN